MAKRPNVQLDLHFQPKQKELLYQILKSDASWVGFGGARGGGKSGGARRVLLFLLGRFPGTQALVIRRTYDEVYKNHVLKLLEEFPALERYYNKTDKILYLTNGSKLHIGYAELPGDAKRYFGAADFSWIYVDQSEQFTWNDLLILKSCVRTTTLGVKPKLVLTFNPGGISNADHKRVFIDKIYQQNERPEDFGPLIRSYGWSNPEWCKEELLAAGLRISDYENWDEETQKAWFLRSKYGLNLLSQPPALQQKWLWGSFSEFEGKYFSTFVDSEPPLGQVYDPKTVKLSAHWPRWISMDGGFAHPSAIYWHAWDGKDVFTYREYVIAEREADQLARDIHRLSNGEYIVDFILSHDWFNRVESEKTRAGQMTTVLDELNRISQAEHEADEKLPITYVPKPRSCSRDRVGGLRLMSQMLTNKSWFISKSCEKLRETLQVAIRDDKKEEDVTIWKGDDPLHGARYGLQVHYPGLRVPQELLLAERFKDASPQGRFMIELKARAEDRATSAPASFRRGSAAA